MKFPKILLGALVCAQVFAGAAAYADQQIGVVDMAVITQKSAKAQDIMTQDKTRQDALKAMEDDFSKQLKDAEKKSPVEKKALEDKLKTQYVAKLKDYRDWTIAQEQTIHDSFDKAVAVVVQTKKLDIVLPKQAVLVGGQDVTDDVIQQMNKP